MKGWGHRYQNVQLTRLGTVLFGTVRFRTVELAPPALPQYRFRTHDQTIIASDNGAREDTHVGTTSLIS